MKDEDVEEKTKGKRTCDSSLRSYVWSETGKWTPCAERADEDDCTSLAGTHIRQKCSCNVYGSEYV